jgi:hypothetical protein
VRPDLVHNFDLHVHLTGCHLLHQESGNAIDFYLMGWDWVLRADRSRGIQFDLGAFNDCRRVLQRAGVRKFGGNADLILVDAHYNGDRSGDIGRVSLDFTEAVRINLASRRADAAIPPVGELLQMIIEAADEVRGSSDELQLRHVFAISDKLGLATAKESF